MGISIIGLTGQTGSGKSSVARFLNSFYKYHIIDCDKVSREVISEYPGCLAELALVFSDKILNPDGELNRAALGSIVFNDNIELQKLNSIVFPYITSSIGKKIQKLSDEGVKTVILDAPTLFESGMDKHCKLVISVLADREIRKERIMKRDKLADDEAISRIDAQLPESYFKMYSQMFFDNNRTEQEMKNQVHNIAKMLESMTDTKKTFI